MREEKAKKSGLIDKIATNYIQAALPAEPSAEPHLLNETEQAVIKKVKQETLIAAAILGVLGVLLLYLPQYYFPQLFPDTAIKLFGKTWPVPIVGTIYGLVLVYAEIYALTYYNVRAVKTIAAACQFPPKGHPDYGHYVQALTDASLEKEHKGLDQFGINPYAGLPKWLVMFYFLLNKLKATLSNLVMKIVVKRVLGRYALRAVTDMAGIPIFAFWNAWASYKVINEAKVRIMCPIIIHQFTNDMQANWGNNPGFVKKLGAALAYVSQVKRNYNYAHFLFAQAFHHKLNALPTVGGEHFLQLAPKLEPELRQALYKVIVFGLCIDGDFSEFEKLRIRKLVATNDFPYNYQQLEKLSADFSAGKGLAL
jgi:hypothetical protein